MKQQLKAGGVFTIEHVRNGEVIGKEEIHNLVVNEGLNHILNTIFHGSTPIGTWYIGVFEGNYTPLATDAATNFAISANESIAYDETSRVVYNEGDAASQSITNSANKATFTINATKTIYGGFLISTSAKSATTGTLMAAAKFGTPRAVVAGDQLLVTYTFSAASA
jgi:hypothetical protein